MMTGTTARPRAIDPRYGPRRGVWVSSVWVNLGLLLAVTMMTPAAPAFAQGIFTWPWEEKNPGPKKSPEPPPAWTPPPPPPQDQVYPPPPQGPAGPIGTASRAPICLDLERRLVQEGKAGGQSRDLIPMVEARLRQSDQQYRASARDLERSDCYEYFLFSKTLRSTKRCVDLARETERLKREVMELETQRSQLIASSGRSYQNEIIRELARNNCGTSYSQQAARRANPYSSVWEEEGGGTGGGLGGSFSTLPYATYRTVCVRLCDGYYFPVSFSTLPNHFQRDADACQSRCASPAELFYYQNPGGSVEQMVSAQTNAPYAQLKSAFRYRKEFVKGCSCKAEELEANQTPIPASQQGDPAAAKTWASQPVTSPQAAAPAPAAPASPAPPSAEPESGGWAVETTTP